RGRAYIEKGRFDEAITDFTDAIKLNANYTDAYAGRGDAYRRKGDKDNALADYDRAIGLNPQLGYAYLTRGGVDVAKAELSKALDDYKRAIELSPNDPYAFLGRGNAYSLLGDRARVENPALSNDYYKLAFDDFNQALALRPNLSDVYRNRGDAYLRRNNPGDSEQAIKEYNQALRLEDNYNPATYLYRGIAYRNTGNVRLAITDLQKALDLSLGKSEDSEIEKGALKELNELRAIQSKTLPIELPATQTAPKIYMEYQDVKDRGLLDQIAKNLNQELGYEVAGRPELVTQPTASGVRFFHDGDKTRAAEVKDVVERTLKRRGIDMTIE